MNFREYDIIIIVEVIIMTIEDKLKNLIRQQYSSIREFTTTINIPYSTLNSIFSRGINNATISNILKICDALHISADALANGEIEYTIDPIDIQTHEVTEIMDNIRKKLLNDRNLLFNGQPADKEAIQAILDAMEVGMEIAKRKTEKK